MKRRETVGGPVTLLLLVIAVAMGCAPPTNSIDTDKQGEDFAGFITEIERLGRSGVVGKIVVESHADKLVRRSMVTITDRTLILIPSEGETKRAGFPSLNVHDHVKIWFAETDEDKTLTPGTAARVVISVGQ